MIMRFAGASGALLMMLYGSGAWAQDNPACAKFTNDFEYNACLAKVGPEGWRHARHCASRF